MRVKRIVINNRAPFDQLDMSFNNADVISLTGINGAGKTTILTYIVDALYEIAKKAYHNEFSGAKEGKYYRVTSILNNLNLNANSMVYICFDNNGKDFDYIDYYGPNDEDNYNNLTKCINNRIPYASIKAYFRNSECVKYTTIDESTAKEIFATGLDTYFPSYRYEQPGYLNDIFKHELSYKLSYDYNGYLPNPIEVVTDLPMIANWIMDVILDNQVYKQDNGFRDINRLVSSILNSKVGSDVRIGIGVRHMGGARIQIVEAKDEGRTIYPTIFNLSSGESALLCIFGELLKQADKIRKPIVNVGGIVLIDEIDKHLNIRIQKEVLPGLFRLFPNVQFIITTHSAFVNIGLSEDYCDRLKVFDLDHNGCECDADTNGVFHEAYDVVIEQNERYYVAYKDILNKQNKRNTPLVVTEGKTDWKHIKHAMAVLGLDTSSIEFYEYEESIGDMELRRMLLNFSRIAESRPIIGVFDRDNLSKLSIKGLDTEKYICLDNNVYAFSIPVVNEAEYGVKEISIEHYYKKNDLTKLDCNGRRLFLGEEFHSKGHSKDGKYCSRCKGMDQIVLHNGIVDEYVYNLNNDLEEKNSVALSKSAFADLVVGGSFSKDFDYSSFKYIYDVIQEICCEIENKSSYGF